MPITIKTGKLKYRKSNGTYDGFDAISNTTTEEQVAAINLAGHVQTSLVEGAGTTQITSIQNKGEEVLDSIPEDYSALSADVGDLKSASTLQAENIPDTVQTITFDSDGNVQSITHTRDGVAIRTDAFTFAANTITEVRALNTGESLTIVTNTDTLQTTVTYTAA